MIFSVAATFRDTVVILPGFNENNYDHNSYFEGRAILEIRTPLLSATLHELTITLLLQKDSMDFLLPKMSFGIFVGGDKRLLLI